MLLPFDIGEIHGALELAYKVIDIGWSDVHDARETDDVQNTGETH
jgi:hypothetical protein